MEEVQFNENMSRICRNDKEGLRKIYEDYCPLIYSVVEELLQNREDAEDVTSEFFIRLWDIAPAYRPGKGHRAWMITIARNMAIDYLRKRKREVLAVQEDKEDGLHHSRHMHPNQPSCETQVCNKLSLEQAMGMLKQEERQIVHLKIMGELTFREIAEIMKKPQGTVSWCYQKAMQKLREVRL